MRAVNPIDAAIRAIPSAWLTPNRRIYWTDMAPSAALGWSTSVAALMPGGRTSVVLTIVAAFPRYRAVLFLHEIMHLSPRDVPGFRAAWNVLMGVPLLLAVTLAVDSVYAATTESDIVPAVAALLRRASQSHG